MQDWGTGWGQVGVEAGDWVDLEGRRGVGAMACGLGVMEAADLLIWAGMPRLWVLTPSGAR